MSTGIYLYCLAPNTVPLEISGMGMDGCHPLATLEDSEFSAIFSEVALEDFCGQEARERLADLAWVAPRALRHEEVIMDAMQKTPVLPVRFGSVFSSKHALESLLARHREALAKFFLDTNNQKEWSLKAYVDMPLTRSRVLETRMADAKARLDGLSPGIRYFQEQKIKGALEREVSAWLGEQAEQLLGLVKEVSTASCEGHILSTDVTGKGDEMFFNVALLVYTHSEAQFQQVLATWDSLHADMGLHLEYCGPLPPYHFTPALEMKA